MKFHLQALCENSLVAIAFIGKNLQAVPFGTACFYIWKLLHTNTKVGGVITFQALDFAYMQPSRTP